MMGETGWLQTIDIAWADRSFERLIYKWMTVVWSRSWTIWRIVPIKACVDHLIWDNFQFTWRGGEWGKRTCFMVHMEGRAGHPPTGDLPTPPSPRGTEHRATLCSPRLRALRYPLHLPTTRGTAWQIMLSQPAGGHLCRVSEDLEGPACAPPPS